MRPIRNLLAALTVALTLVPSAAAVDYGFGSAVGGSDYDLSPMAESQRVALCFIDIDGDGVPVMGEPVFLMTRVATNGVCPATLSTPSILLTDVPGRVAGSEANGADPWAGKTVRTLTDLHAVRYVEDGSDASKMDGKDTLYLDLKNVASARVDVGDVRLSGNGPAKAGSTVKAGDADLARPLTEIRGTLRQMHSSNVVYKASSGFYVNADAGALGGTVDGSCATTACAVTGDFGVESGDVRLNAKAVNPLSDTASIGPDRVELVQAHVLPGQPFQVKVTMKNAGKAPGAGLVETTIDDVVVDGRGTPTIEANGVATLTITLVAPLAPGQHVVKAGTYADFLQVDEVDAGQASLEAQADGASRLDPLQEGRGTVKASGAPGLAPLGALATLGAVLVALRRRQA